MVSARRPAKPVEAVSYLRVSGRGQVDGDGFDRQREAIERFAACEGYELVGQYRDEGVSGTKDLAARPGLAALLDRLESNGVKVVIVERADRLARDLMVSEVILDQLTRAGSKRSTKARQPADERPVRVLTADGVDL